jgi:hypothetical protein
MWTMLPKMVGLATVIALATGCPGPAVEDESDASEADADATDPDATDDDTATDSTAAEVGWFEIGWGVEEFNALQPGGDLEVVWGSQGAAMFPLPLRGAEFVLPDPPSDYQSPLAPKLDLHIDVEGHNDGIGGHFMYLANYPITFEIMPDGSYEFLFVAAVLPDEVDPATLEGLPAHLYARLRPYESAAFEVELDLVVRQGEQPR